MLPWTWEGGDPGHARAGGAELAAKMRFLHDTTRSLDAALFPRVILPAAGDAPRHLSFDLPLWLQWTGQRWSPFGGASCRVHPAGNEPDACLAGWVVTRRFGDALAIGAELVHRGRSGGVPAATEPGLGVTYDVGEHVHLIASAGPGLQGLDQNPRTHWYAALLATW